MGILSHLKTNTRHPNLELCAQELVPELEEKTKSLLEMQSKVEKIKREVCTSGMRLLSVGFRRMSVQGGLRL